jgi:hypothetical protein
MTTYTLPVDWRRNAEAHPAGAQGFADRQNGSELDTFRQELHDGKQVRPTAECWLTDMDGVLVREEHALPGAAEFLQRLIEAERRFWPRRRSWTASYPAGRRTSSARGA